MSKINEIAESPQVGTVVTDPRDAGLRRWVNARFEGLIRQLNERLKIADQELDPGYPGVGAVEQVVGNLRGQWVSVAVTAGGLITFTHNMNLPVVVVSGRAYNHPNVTWYERFTFGDRTGANAAPAAPATTTHTSVHFRYGDAVTANAIELRVHTDLAIGATAPLNVDVRFFPAIT